MNPHEPQISVILPVHNRTQLLPRAIASVLRQSFADLELIVVDDASTEDIPAVLEQFADSRIRYHRREQQGGPGAARNTGITQARAPYLAFQDSDDEWLLDKLAYQMSAMQESGAALICCAMLRHHPGHMYSYTAPERAQFSGDAARRWIESDCKAFTQTWLLRRDALEATGPFDENLAIWEDWELLLRIAHTHEVRFIADALVLSYASDDGISTRTDLRVRSLEHLLAKLQHTQQSQQLLARLAYMLGRFRLLAGDTRGARAALRKALRITPRNLRAWLLLFASYSGRAPQRVLGTGRGDA